MDDAKTQHEATHIAPQARAMNRDAKRPQPVRAAHALVQHRKRAARPLHQHPEIALVLHELDQIHHDAPGAAMGHHALHVAHLVAPQLPQLRIGRRSGLAP
jgi:hypothetical protein